MFWYVFWRKCEQKQSNTLIYLLLCSLNCAMTHGKTLLKNVSTRSLNISSTDVLTKARHIIPLQRLWHVVWHLYISFQQCFFDVLLRYSAIWTWNTALSNISFATVAFFIWKYERVRYCPKRCKASTVYEIHPSYFRTIYPQDSAFFLFSLCFCWWTPSLRWKTHVKSQRCWLCTIKTPVLLQTIHWFCLKSDACCLKPHVEITCLESNSIFAEFGIPFSTPEC